MELFVIKRVYILAVFIIIFFCIAFYKGFGVRYINNVFRYPSINISTSVSMRVKRI